ncbi:MAG TPA: hypothetical protein VEH84_08900 [Alphaproteobacteria bacterium]|nr:hypothetical protein [Alphaproteobacteria bacterium]
MEKPKAPDRPPRRSREEVREALRQWMREAGPQQVMDQLVHGEEIEGAPPKKP